MTGLLPKRLCGRALFTTAELMPSLRPWLERWGRRTQTSWFTDKVATAYSELTGRRIRIASIGGNYLSFELFWRGLDYYEPLTAALARTLTGPTGLFIDIGANIGYHSLMLAAVRPRVEIVAFEPHPELNGFLQANVEANGFDQIRVERYAVSNAEGVRPFYLNRSHMSASLEPNFDSAHTGVVEVPITTLDAWIAQRADVPPRFLLKVDVEGHETELFAGARETLRRYRPDIIAEAVHRFSPETVELLRSCGYRFRQITDEGLRPCLEPTAYVRGALVFLNCLLTTRSSGELEVISAEIRAQARAIDLRLTSKLADPKVLDRFRDEAPAEATERRGAIPALLPGRWPNPQL